MKKDKIFRWNFLSSR